jgi:methionine-rich copper-binding protein CopC
VSCIDSTEPAADTYASMASTIFWVPLLVFLSVFAPSTVFGHAYLVKSIPAQRAVLLRAPAKIQLWFNERLEPRYSSLTVNDETGKKVEVVKTEVGPEDPKQIIATLKPLAAGRYIIKYRVLSVDGHVVQDQFAFTVKQ